MNLFVYGTLQSAKLRAAVAGGATVSVSPAQLTGYCVYPVAGDVVPFIARNDSGCAKGMIMRAVDPQQRLRLDAYEGAFGYRLSPVTVEGPNGPETVQMYLPPDDIAQGQGAWSFDAWQAGYETMAVHGAVELFSQEPPLSPEQIGQQWAMIGKRAWTRSQLGAGQQPDFACRHIASRDEFELRRDRPAVGQFFKFEAMNVSYRMFNGETAGPLPREGFIGVDAVMVLPYDRARDVVLLVEQFRVGPALRGDRQPWSLEPVAGMIDATETPEQTALREAKEEANLSQVTLIAAGQSYPSPGSTTDYFYSFVGLCDLPPDHAGFGGLASEAEDLRLHIIPRKQAMQMIDTGEINAGPLVQLLYWLEINKDRMVANG